MSVEKYQFQYEVYKSIDDLLEEDKNLVIASRENTSLAYAPYSNFNVSSVAILNNGEMVKGTNQENASYPVSICAERAMLATVAALYPNVGIKTIAISYHNQNAESNKPISPCGMCRQALVEYEERVQQPIRLILSGMEGEIIIIEKAHALLPFSFKSGDLK